MTPYTQRQQQLIVSNVLKACKDIDKLNRNGYDFLYLSNGFIAHYDINGFKAHYSEHSLQRDIEDNARSNQWNNFRPGERDYEYYMSKKEIYNKILGALVAEEYLATYGA